MTISHWRRTSLLGVVECDVVIVGAGVCGLTTALHLQRRGVHAIVVERHALAAGASSRNAGFLMRGAADNYEVAVRAYGRDLARTVWRWTEENLEGLRSEGIEGLASTRRISSCLLALEPVERDELQASVALLHQDGFAVQWVDSGSDTAWRNAKPLGGLVNPEDGSCNPYDVMRLLASRLPRPVVEGQEAAQIAMTQGPRPMVVRTQDAMVRCERVVVCTNAYAPLLLPPLQDRITPRRGQMLALRIPDVRFDYSYYANRGYEYFRQAADGTVVFGGCRKAHADAEVGYDDRVTPEVQGDIEAFAATILGVAREGVGRHISARWSGTMGFSPDGLPLIGAIPGQWDAGRVWFCGGFTGHGMSLAHRCARAVVEEMLDGVATPFPLARVGL